MPTCQHCNSRPAAYRIGATEATDAHVRCSDCAASSSEFATIERLTESVHPGQLEVGDIVHAHGMVLLIDRAPTLSTAHAGGRTFYTDALVTNRDEVSGDAVPYSFTERTPEDDARRGIRPEHRVTRPEHRWTLQGNDGAFVAREIR